MIYSKYAKRVAYCILVLSLGVAVYSIFSYRKVSTKVTELQQQLVTPREINPNTIAEPTEVVKVIQTIPCISEISLITEMQNVDNRLQIKRSITVDDISSLELPAFIEVTLVSTNVEASLEFLTKHELIYNSLTVADNTIDFIIQLGGSV